MALSITYDNGCHVLKKKILKAVSQTTQSKITD